MTFPSSQNSVFPPVGFSISTPLRNVRLMEVPDDLAGVIGGVDGLNGDGDRRKGRGRVRLKFKSSMPSTTSTTLASSKPKEGFVHLCSNDKIWTVKQVSTSNSVYVIQPTTTTTARHPARTENLDIESNDNDTEMTDTTPQDPENQPYDNNPEARRTVTALSKVSNFLELQSLPINEQAIEHSIRDILPIYTLPNEFDDLPRQSDRDIALATATANISTKPPTLMKDLLNNLPYPDDVIRKICRKLCVFEASETVNNNSDDDNRSSGTNKLMGRKQLFVPKKTRRRLFIPSLKAQLTVWQKIVDTCSIEGIALHESITELTVERIADLLDDENIGANESTLEDVSSGIAKAMLIPPSPSLSPSSSTTITTENPTTTNDKITTTTTTNIQLTEEKGGSLFSEMNLYTTQNKLDPEQTTTWIATMLLRTFPFFFSPSSSSSSSSPSSSTQRTKTTTINNHNDQNNNNTKNDENNNNHNQTLETTATQIPLETFLSTWTNLVPSATFVKYCTKSSLISSGLISSVRIREGDGVEVIDLRDGVVHTGGDLSVGGGLSGGVGMSGSAVVGKGGLSVGSSGSGGSNKRKWHERLGGTRTGR